MVEYMVDDCVTFRNNKLRKQENIVIRGMQYLPLLIALYSALASSFAWLTELIGISKKYTDVLKKNHGQTDKFLGFFISI